jgi:hypothetical protein
MSTVLFVDDPKYNGPHTCPKCGSASQWIGKDAGARMVTVQCEGICGDYTEPYSRLSDYPHFQANVIQPKMP